MSVLSDEQKQAQYTVKLRETYLIGRTKGNCHDAGLRAVAEAAIAAELEEVQKLLVAIKYIIGIVERGEGRKMRDDESVEQFVLGYVKKLEAIATDRAARAEPVAWIEFDGASVAYSPNKDAARRLPVGVRFDLYTAQPAAPVVPVVPEGYALVPMKPTERMLDHAVSFALNVGPAQSGGWTEYARRMWETMVIAAASQQDADKAQGVGS